MSDSPENVVDYAPGMRLIIRDEEWMVKKVETNSLDKKTIHCVGISPLVKDHDSMFLADIEDIEQVDPAKVKLVADTSPFFRRSRLYIESQWRQKIPTDTNLHIGNRAAMDTMNFQLEPAQIALRKTRQRILIADLWNGSTEDKDFWGWSKNDGRLDKGRFPTKKCELGRDTPARTSFERRQLLVELDVLVSLSFGLTIDQPKAMYVLQFPVLKKYEEDTWYDQNGRIVFSAKNMGDLTYSRPEWEAIKDATQGTFTRTVTDDTQPAGPVERSIEYVAPFDRCDREKDYETAWAFFEAKYNK